MSGIAPDEEPSKKGLLENPVAHHEEYPGAYQNAGITVGQPASIPQAIPVAGVPVGALNYSNGV